MTIQMENSNSLLSKEIAQPSTDYAVGLFKQACELEQIWKTSLQTKSPSDPSVWNQLREIYEAIILADHDFSQKHEIEHALWNLYYRKIEDFRNRIRMVANAINNANANPANRNPVRRDQGQLIKIRATFKSFLAEATGFYHDLILKIRSKYGLPVDYFPNQGEEFGSFEYDKVKTSNIRKARISCHQCFIYLGDLARYKEFNVDDPSNLDFSVASSYYIQAASLWPSSGNPHHQLAIVATYSGDELVTLYRYFRSLAVEFPFNFARENMTLFFEKNRQSYSQLPQESEMFLVKQSFMKGAGRGKQRSDARLLAKEQRQGSVLVKKNPVDLAEINITFRTRFVRLNGILFTRTSLETFDDVCASALSDLEELLSPKFDSDTASQAYSFSSGSTIGELVIIQLISILIFSVDNIMNADKQNMSMSEVLLRSVLLQNAFTATFEIAVRIIKKCGAVEDVSACPCLPAVMVFLEWLACRPDIIKKNEADNQQPNAKTGFWTECIMLLNKLNTIQQNVNGDSNEGGQGKYSGEPGRSVALWEDFELKGFVPLAQAQVVLDFSKRPVHNGLGGKMERSLRIKRILAAGNAIASLLDDKRLQTNSNAGTSKVTAEDASESKNLVKSKVKPPLSLGPKSENLFEEILEDTSKMGVPMLEVDSTLSESFKEDEEDEVIVFKPAYTEKHPKPINAVPRHLGAEVYTPKPVVSSTTNDYRQNHSSSQQMPEFVNVQNMTSMKVSEGSQQSFSGLPVSNELSLKIPGYSSVLSTGIDRVFPQYPGSEVSLSYESSAASSDPWSTGFGLPNATLPSSHEGWVSQGYNGGIVNNFGMPGAVDFGQQPTKQSDSAWYRDHEAQILSGMMNMNLGAQFERSDMISKLDAASKSMGHLEPVHAHSNWNASQSLYSVAPLVTTFPVGSSSSSMPENLAGINSPINFDQSPFARHQLLQSNAEALRPVGTISTSMNTENVPKLTLRNGPVSRPVARHHGPPPGFGPVPSKSPDGSKINPYSQPFSPSMELRTDKNDELQVDDYSWLDGYTPSKNDGDIALSSAMNLSFPVNKVPNLQVNHEQRQFEMMEHQLQLRAHQQQKQSGQQQQSLWSGPGQLYG